MKKFILLAVGLVIGTTMFGQFRLDVEGDAKIQGAIELLNSSEDTSIIIGYQAGESRRVAPLQRGAKSRHAPGPPNNVFIGKRAGMLNEYENNTFIGSEAGRFNRNIKNTFIGSYAGRNSTGAQNTFLGADAGREAMGNSNVSIGWHTGVSNTKGSKNIFLGAGADISGNNDSLNNAIAIGYSSRVGCSNCAVIGGQGMNLTNLGIGTSTPVVPLHIQKSNVNYSHDAEWVALFEDTSDAYIAILTNEENSSGMVFQNNTIGFSGGIFHNTSSNPNGLSFKNNGVQNMLIDATGNVAIGPVVDLSNRLEVASDIEIGGNTENHDGFSEFLQIHGQSGWWHVGAKNAPTESDTDFFIGSSYLEDGIFHIERAGNIGIGTSEPDTKLHIKSIVDNNGTTAALKITSNNQNMLLDGNEIDSDADLHLNHNSDRHVYAVRGGGDMVIGGTRQNINSRLQVHGNAAKSSGGTTWSTFSDRRLKKNIRPYTDGLEQLLRIKPVHYRYNGRLGTSDKQEEIGIIAQEIQKIAPYMVSDFEHQDEKGRKENYLTYNSNALFYMLVNGVKTLHQNNLDQQKVIDTQAENIQQLEDKINAIEVRFAQLERAIKTTEQQDTKSIQHIELKAIAQLAQNHPNPFHDYTNIQYAVPNGVQKALIRITDTSGKILKEQVLNQVGKGQVQIKATHFPAGTYYYSLILDGQLFETKRMILAWK